MLYVCIVHNIKTFQTQLILNCVFITDVCKPPKNVDFSEIVHPFMLVWFEGFLWVYYSCWEDRTYSLPCVLFGYKNVRKSLQRTISNMENSWNIQRTSKLFNKKTQIEKKLFHRSVGEYTLFLPISLPF